jgi:hypothetical protein
MTLPVLSQPLERSILLVRGHRVMLDADLAKLYSVSAKTLNQAVKRNASRFPADFMFQLAEGEATALRSQFVTLKTGRGQHRKYRPYAFTEQGVAMLSSVLHSERAVQVNISIMRAFVQLREMISSNKGLARRFNELEKKYDSQFRVVFEAIRELMSEPEPKVKRIGFKT